MKQYLRFISKFTVVTIMCFLFSGCATTESQNSSERDQTNGVNNTDVIAVMKTGKIEGSPDEINNLLHKKRYFFQLNSDEINPDDYKALKALALLLQSQHYKNSILHLIGHTDQRGTRSYNMTLGLRRAVAIQNYLITQGVSRKKIKSTSMGFETPLDPENNPVAWAKNRRVETTISDEKQ